MKGLLVGGGLFIIVFICVIPLHRKIEEYDTQKNGQLITVTITHIPYCTGSKIREYMEFNYNGKKFDKKVSCSIRDSYKEGDTIKLKHKEGTDIFLFENEKIEIEFISIGLLALFGMYCIRRGAKQK